MYELQVVGQTIYAGTGGIVVLDARTGTVLRRSGGFLPRLLTGRMDTLR